jgi:large subunit ribosomal protein L5
MEDFFYRLIHVVLPRVRDFRGLSPRAFDGQGNYTLGLTEHTVFPEISADDVTRTHPLEITVVTSTKEDDEARELFTRLGFPFIGKDGKRG